MLGANQNDREPLIGAAANPCLVRRFPSPDAEEGLFPA